MIFYLHFILLTSGLSGTSVLLGVFMKYYSDASQAEIGVLLMTFPFMCILVKPLFCSLADRHQRHRGYMILSLMVLIIGYLPFVIIPYFPNFYTQMPRISWYTLVVGSYTGNAGLAVAWSLGESLAMNAAQRKNTPYSRLRLCGTVSWGVYGYIIGQINEVPFLPKFVPAFLILHISVLVEILLFLLWDKEEFVMVDIGAPIAPDQQNKLEASSEGFKMASPPEQRKQHLEVDSTPSSLGGTLRLKAKSGMVIRDYIMADDLLKRLKNLDHHQDELRLGQEKLSTPEGLKKFELAASNHSTLTHKAAALAASSMIDCEKSDPNRTDKLQAGNPQMIMFKMILAEDGRLIKYLVLFTMVGILLAPLNFVFLSLDEVCKEKGCNFSQLAGSVLISQATSETFCFFVMPWVLLRVRRSTALLFALAIMAARFFFYANFYYTSDISPYWALAGEWGHGIPYGICATILADIALMFANQCKLFIPELRQLGLISQNENGQNKEKVLAEENAMKMALRATMQAIFAAGMDGLGSGVGSLVCGVIAEAFSYIKLWHLFTIMALGTAVIHQLIEVTKSKWSDSFKPLKGSKAFEIRSLEHGHKGETAIAGKLMIKQQQQQLSDGGDCELAHKC